MHSRLFNIFVLHSLYPKRNTNLPCLSGTFFGLFIICYCVVLTGIVNIQLFSVFFTALHAFLSDVGQLYRKKKMNKETKIPFVASPTNPSLVKRLTLVLAVSVSYFDFSVNFQSAFYFSILHGCGELWLWGQFIA